MTIKNTFHQSVIQNIIIIKGDITLQETDAIVNAANPSLLGGGGVDGAIHKAAGPLLLRECELLHGCPPGDARMTSGYNLPARFVIHTPGPVYRGGNHNEKSILINSYVSTLKLAFSHGLKSISFPAIATGIYGYPKKNACTIALNTTITFCVENCYQIKVYFVLFDEDNLKYYKEELKRLVCEHQL